MLAILLHYWLDVLLFATMALAATFAVHLWLRNGGHGGLRRRDWAAVAGVVVLATVITRSADDRERGNLRQRLEGLAPTYAQEIELLGHSRVGPGTPPDSADYLKIIAAEIRWEKVNPNVADIYTFRRRNDGKVMLVVDSETDYDHNGVIAGDREQRTAIGEVYEEATPQFLAALNGKAGFDGEPYTDRWGTWISAYVPLYDSTGQVEAALGVDYDASRWNSSVALARLGALGMAGVFLAVVIGATSVVAIKRSELAKRLALQRQLVDTSRQAGMAEMATGVLHNVGNVLNSVNVSAGLLTEKLRASKVAGFGKAAGMIRDNREHFAEFVATDAKGKVLPDYLIRLADLLAGEQTEWLGELSSLSRNLDHAKRVVASQQTLAKSVGLIEHFEMADLVEDALRINAPGIAKGNVTVLRSIGACPDVTADRHAVLQVLVNLIGNALQSMQQSAERRLSVNVESVTDVDGTTAARVTVSDTGCGMTGDTLAKLFTHGFTTRPDGHGFGLHHSANAAHAMGGRIAAASDGPGRGATFTLTLPLVVSEKGLPCLTA